MLLALKRVYRLVESSDSKYLDPRTQNWILVGSPLKLFALTALYYAFIKKIGPEMMKNRPAFALKNVLLIYNLLQIVLNTYLAYTGTYVMLNFKDWGCIRFDNSYNPNALLSRRMEHLYFLLKVFDYTDTILFVLRKRYNQITFLHIYHHMIMAIGCFLHIRYQGDSAAIFLGYVNLFVHAIMYFYYFISALRNDMRNSIGWKRYITQVQMIQFTILMCYFGRTLFRRNCEVSKILMSFCLLQNAFMFVMFTDFYIKTYILKPRAKLEVK